MRMLPAVSAALALALAAVPLATVQAQSPKGASPLANAPGAKLTIYHLEGRRSERIVWLCEELGIPYNIVYTQGDLQKSMDEIRKVRPLMPAAPTVVYNGQVLSESASILQVLIDRERPGKLIPAVNSPDYPEHLMWMGFAEGTLAADVVADYRVGMATGGKRPSSARGQLDGQRAMAFAEDFLSRHPYFGGSQFTAADIMMWFPTDFADRVKVADIDKYPHVAAWQDKMEQRPAFKRMLAVARPNGRVGSLTPLKVQ